MHWTSLWFLDDSHKMITTPTILLLRVGVCPYWILSPHVVGNCTYRSLVMNPADQAEEAAQVREAL